MTISAEQMVAQDDIGRAMVTLILSGSPHTPTLIEDCLADCDDLPALACWLATTVAGAMAHLGVHCGTSASFTWAAFCAEIAREPRPDGEIRP